MTEPLRPHRPLPPLWQADEVAAAVGGLASAPFDATGVSIDSRRLQPGDLFIALKGPRFAGHSYAAQAMRAGAAGVLSDRPLPYPHVLVTETTQALKDLGAAARQRFAGHVIAVTGSVGKTTTKELLVGAHSPFSRVHATQGNLNNQLGLPLTLARVPREADTAIVELGMNHFGEIAALSRLAQPTAALITAIDWVHSENLDGTLEGVAKAKMEIVAGLQGPLYAPITIRNLLTPYLDNQLDNQLDNELDHQSGKQQVIWVEAPFEGQLALQGQVQRWNAALALATVPALHRTAAAQGLSQILPPQGRGREQELTIRGKKIRLIDDSYNAAPASMRAALTQLCTPGRSRKIAVIGDMAELANPLQHHQDLGAFLADLPIDMVIAVGSYHEAILKSLPPSFHALGLDDASAVVPYLLGQLQQEDHVLVKASNATGLTQVVRDMHAAAQQD